MLCVQRSHAPKLPEIKYLKFEHFEISFWRVFSDVKEGIHKFSRKLNIFKVPVIKKIRTLPCMPRFCRIFGIELIKIYRQQCVHFRKSLLKSSKSIYPTYESSIFESDLSFHFRWTFKKRFSSCLRAWATSWELTRKSTRP